MNAFEGLGDNWPFSQSGADILNSLTEAADVFVFAYSPTLKSLVSWTDNAQSVLGARDVSITREANAFLRYMHPDDRFVLLDDFEQALKGERAYRATYRWIRPDTNATHWLHCRGKIFRSEDEKLLKGIIVDITQELSSSSSGLTAADSLDGILNAFPQCILTLDSDLRILRVNKDPEEFLGEPANFWFGDEQFEHEKLLPGRKLLDAFSDVRLRENFESDLLAVLTGARASLTKRFFSEGRSAAKLEISPIAVRGAPQGLLIVLSDVSEVVRLERRVNQLEKMEGLRNLAIGLANNFNNALQSIIGQAATIRDNLNDEHLIEHASQVIVDVAQKASALTDQLLHLGSQSGESPTRVDLNIAVMSAVNRIEDIFSGGFKVAVSLGSPPPIYGDSERIEQAIESALRGLPDLTAREGSVSIGTQLAFVGEHEVAGLTSGSYAQLTLHVLDPKADTGEEAHDTRGPKRPFMNFAGNDPRKADLHSNEQLSQALMILEKLGGTIQHQRSTKSGSFISLYFPAVPVAESDMPPRPTETPAITSKPSQAPEILIVDDDLTVLETIAAVLRGANYHCLTAATYRQALVHAKKHGHTLQLILLDALMPEMDGAKLLKRLKRIRPEFRVIGFSGAPPEVTKKLLDAGAMRVLRKPIDPIRLREVVGETVKAQRAA